MARRQVNRLTARAVATITAPGMHADGGGLYLAIDAAGARRWVLRYRHDGRRRDMGLGSAAHVSLADARKLATDARAHLVAGRDPVEERRRAAMVEGMPTFGEVADRYLATKEVEFRNATHRAQWRMTLTRYAAPIRDKPVDQIGTDDVLGVLRPLWQRVPETASRLRGRIEAVLNAAKAQGYRTGENPAAWRGHLANLLAKRHKLTRGHHPAMPYPDVPAFIVKLRARQAVSARALEFTILTAARTGEVTGMTWGEIDRKAAVWTIPAGRMKGGREHRVPLTPAAMVILSTMAGFGADPAAFVFPGQRRGKPLSRAAMSTLLERMDVPFTVHGFRSSFRDWVGNETGFPREVAEAAIAHVVGDEAEQAYRRSDALAKRRKMMAAWAGYLDRLPGGNVVAITARR